MSTVCLLIGFCYQEHSMMSSMVDLYLMHGLFLKRQWKIHTFSDRHVREDTYDYIIDDSDIHLVYSSENLISNIDSLDMSKDHVVVYYTGHGEEDGCLRLPNGDKIKFSHLRELISSRCDEDTEILFVMDCCYSGNMSLSYIYDSTEKRFIYNEEGDYSDKKIMILSSSKRGEESSSICNGSFFTRFFIEAVEKKRLTLESLVTLVKRRTLDAGIEGEQEMMIYSSRPHHGYLWTWIMYPFTIEIVGATIVVYDSRKNS